MFQLEAEEGLFVLCPSLPLESKPTWSGTTSNGLTTALLVLAGEPVLCRNLLNEVTLMSSHWHGIREKFQR